MTREVRLCEKRVRMEGDVRYNGGEQSLVSGLSGLISDHRMLNVGACCYADARSQANLPRPSSASALKPTSITMLVVTFRVFPPTPAYSL